MNANNMIGWNFSQIGAGIIRHIVGINFVHFRTFTINCILNYVPQTRWVNQNWSCLSYYQDTCVFLPSLHLRHELCKHFFLLGNELSMVTLVFFTFPSTLNRGMKFLVSFTFFYDVCLRSATTVSFTVLTILILQIVQFPHPEIVHGAFWPLWTCQMYWTYWSWLLVNIIIWVLMLNGFKLFKYEIKICWIVSAQIDGSLESSDQCHCHHTPCRILSRSPLWQGTGTKYLLLEVSAWGTDCFLCVILLNLHSIQWIWLSWNAHR